jgi:hypothetical protein
MHRLSFGTFALITASTLAACSDGSGPSAGGQLAFSLATKSTSAAAASAASASVIGTPETFTDGTNTLVIDTVQLVVRELELKRAEATTSCGESGGDHCEKLQVGPLLLDLPLGAGTARAFSVPLAAGTYSEVEFEIHQPSDDDASDAAFVQAHPDFANRSVLVTGTFNGTRFSYSSDLNAEEEIELSPPLVTTDAAAADLTLLVDLDRWFRDGTGGLVDPATANVGLANESLVETNIRGTLHAFEDENHDGSDDHGGDHGTDGSASGSNDGPSHT